MANFSELGMRPHPHAIRLCLECTCRFCDSSSLLGHYDDVKAKVKLRTIF